MANCDADEFHEKIDVAKLTWRARLRFRLQKKVATGRNTACRWQAERSYSRP
jgi:hypothetical protein